MVNDSIVARVWHGKDFFDSIDPNRALADQFCCAAQRSRATPSTGRRTRHSRLSRPMMCNKLVFAERDLWNI
jgi:hypothetical protein